MAFRTLSNNHLKANDYRTNIILLNKRDTNVTISLYEHSGIDI